MSPIAKPRAGAGRPPAQKASDDQLLQAYAADGSVWKVAARFGMCGQSVHERLVKLGAAKPINHFSAEERETLLAQYDAAADAGKLDDLAKAMGRTKQFLARQARALGLTNPRRAKAYLAAQSQERMAAWHKINPHPRGMLGKRHSDVTRQVISKKGEARWAAMTEEQQAAHILKQLKAREKNQTLHVSRANTTSWKAEWREIGGVRKFFRSRWEANYARYLEMLRVDGKIDCWEHEPKTFWFEDIMRGSRSYLPDFRVVDADGNETFHEVKGWMDSRSRTKIARMKKYFPEVSLIVIDSKEYNKINKYFRFIVPGWE